MLRIETGGPGLRRADIREGSAQEDVDLVAELVAVGFRGRLWEKVASDLVVYAFQPLLHAMRLSENGKLAGLVAKSKKPLRLTDEERATLHHNQADREQLALMTISVAMETFPKVLKEGGYDPAKNTGKGGKPARLFTFFYGRCGLVFPTVFENWREERAQRFAGRATAPLDIVDLAHTLGRGTSQPQSGDEFVELCDQLIKMINELNPRDKAVWIMTLMGESQGEIADALGIKVGDVENARYKFRKAVKIRREEGTLVVPPRLEAEWRLYPAWMEKQKKQRKKVVR
ncbi:RNA polymerase sigma factor [Streptomyces hydrogenans]